MTLGPSVISTGASNGVTWTSFEAGKFNIQAKSRFVESCGTYSMDFMIVH